MGKQAKVKKILAIRNDRFGEFLLNIPALRALKESFPEAELVLAVDPYVSDLARCLPFIDRVIAWKGQKQGFLEILRRSRLLKKEGFDIAVMLNPAKDFNIMTALAGIPVRAGYDRKWGFLLTHKIPDLKHLALKHEVEYNLELVGLVGAKTENKTLSLCVPDGIINNLFKEFDVGDHDKLVALHPWTSDPFKQWPKERFQELAVRLSAEPGVRVVLVGSRQGAATEENGLDGKIAGLIDLTGKTSLVQLAALLKRCCLLISCDSGPIHLSCCVGTPVVALFRSDLPAKSAARWGPWGIGHTVLQSPSLARITPDEVLAKVKEKL